MMNLLEAALLGILQGITEFLPISSSGHLVLAQQFIGADSENLLFSIVVHVATLCATLVVLRQKVYMLITSVPPFKGKHDIQFAKQNQKTLLWIVITTFVTGILGLLLEDFFKEQFSSITQVAYCLIATGLILLLPKLLKFQQKRTMHELGPKRAVFMGLAQTLAILPGISRSGTTIVSGLGLGLTRKDAGEYAFLISVPIILAALLLEMLHVESLSNVPWATMIVGFVAAFGSGWISLTFLLRWVQKGALHYFTIYCWLLAAAILTF